MDPGLVVIALPGSAYRVRVLVGWLRHKRGPWWEIVGARTMLRHSWSKVTGFASLANKGLTANHYLLDASRKPPVFLDLHLRGIEYCDEEVWCKAGKTPNGGTLDVGYVKPKDWAEQVAA